MRAWLLCALVACTPTSELTLRVIVDDAALEAVELPSRVIVDYDNGEYRSIDLCEYDGQEFLEVDLPAVAYKECRTATTIRGVLVHHDEAVSACITGRLSERHDSFPDQAAWAGYGEAVVFETQTCGVIQEATLTVDGL